MDEEKITIKSKKNETGNFKIYTTDSFGASDEITIKFTCFDNLIPIAILDIEDIPETIFEKKLNATNSYDPDAEHGGGIAIYRFFVNGKEIDKTYHPYMNYTFPLPGQYEIGLEVRDSDNKWSNRTTKTVIIN
jgi:hypothetical protein